MELINELIREYPNASYTVFMLLTIGSLIIKQIFFKSDEQKRQEKKAFDEFFNRNI